ncbi:MAG: DNA alkylation repair protein [Ignavibacteriales bacterium]|nr:DNA alkylation repair protein [Ignavibacteriales bacterium]
MQTENIPVILLEEFSKKANPAFAKMAGEKYGLHAENYLGLRNPEIYAVADVIYPQLKNLPINELLAICSALLANGNKECRFTAFRWASKACKKLLPEHLPLFDEWLNQYMHDWADCDFLSTKVVGELFVRNPECIPQTHVWAASAKLFVRRAAAVTLIVPVKRIGVLQESFAIAETMLLDKEDLVQKGYGWLLKVAADRFPDEVFAFILERKNIMPRTALRYAIEKMPDDMRARALSRD